MTTKRQLRSENIKEKKTKKSTRILYLSFILGGIFILLVLFFLTLFNVLFPPVDMDALKKKEKQVVQIYFSDQQERFLKSEKRYIFKENDAASQAREIVKALIEGSKTGLVNTFPSGVVLRDVKVSDTGIALVNFSKSLTKLHQGGSTAEMATIYSLTNSITQNIPSIKKVKILVEGKELSSIKGHISTRKAFIPDWELLISEKEKNS
ncbi:MAG: GerMN domain-containing protein [Deltaproteobacteria bacterium]|nr:GerMN domain-containing protein [Deltaproteobacteria bacterium]